MPAQTPNHSSSYFLRSKFDQNEQPHLQRIFKSRALSEESCPHNHRFRQNFKFCPEGPPATETCGTPLFKTKGEVGCKALFSTSEIKALGNFGGIRHAESRGLKIWTWTPTAEGKHCTRALQNVAVGKSILEKAMQVP